MSLVNGDKTVIVVLEEDCMEINSKDSIKSRYSRQKTEIWRILALSICLFRSFESKNRYRVRDKMWGRERESR